MTPDPVQPHRPAAVVGLLCSLLFCHCLLAADDPRPGLIELQLAGDIRTALASVDELIRVQPENAAAWGLAYLQGHLLDRLGRQPEAIDAFAAAMITTPTLSAHVRYRLAIDRLESGYPQMAAGLLATLLATGSPPALTDDVIALLNRAIAAGADCKILATADSWKLQPNQRRRLQASVIACDPTPEPTAEGEASLVGLLRTSRSDETARRAASRLAARAPRDLGPSTSVLVGLTLFEHREFERAIGFLESPLILVDATAATRGFDADEARFALARSYFWLGDYAAAEDRFAELAERTAQPGVAAQALYQRGRSFELLGMWEEAIATFHRAAVVEPAGSWAAAATVSAMRLEWRQGREGAALASFEKIRKVGRWRSSLERAALYLAVSDIVTGRADRAGGWLEIAYRATPHDSPEIDYWRARLAELEGDTARALEHYTALLTGHPYHPLAQGARARLRRPALAAAAATAGQRYADSSRTRNLLRARQLLPRDHPLRPFVDAKLRELWWQNTTARSLLDATATPPREWSVWRSNLDEPDVLLMALGITEAYTQSFRRVFALSDTDLALAGSRLLALSGLHRRSLYYAEVVSQRAPRELPDDLLDPEFRRLLYPRPYDFSIEQQSRRFGIDPHLLRSIIREESRFDPLAVSAASARGLTQFVLPTARRLGAKLAWPELDAWALHDPRTAVTLGAAYLAELDRRFAGRTHVVIAAYNAGENQARLWQAHCYSQEPEEFYSKTGFRQTRDYLAKVEASRAQYREIYAASPAAYPEAAARLSTTGGSES